MKIVSGINDLITLNPSLAQEWDYEKNDIDPNTISPNSHEKAWWKCRNEHSWIAEIKSRNQGSGCPTCHKYIKTSFPEQIVYFYIQKYFDDAIWNYYGEELNGSEIDIYIPSIKVGIEYDGQYYHQNSERDIKKDKLCSNLSITLSRIREPKCPKYQSGANFYFLNDLKKNTLEEIIRVLLVDLGIKNPKIDIYKDYVKITDLITHITAQRSLKTECPDIAREWNYEKNGLLKPEHVRPGSNKRVWWICSACNNQWIASVNNRVFGTGCPECAKRRRDQANSTPKVGCSLADVFPNVAKNWNYDKNKLSPYDVAPYSNKKVWWVCDSKHEWKSTISNRTQGRGCPICARTKKVV